MVRAKAVFRMKDRSEHEIVVDGADHRELQQNARAKLSAYLEKLADEAVEAGTALPEGFAIIESWQITPETGGTPSVDKKDGIAVRSALQKVRFDLLPWVPLVEVARVFTFGAHNYGDRNWEEGFSWSRCIGSTLRHFVKWLLGEERDDESGLHHLAHSIANLLFLLEYVFRGKGTDDRRTVDSALVFELFSPVNADITKKKG